jgi:hypothetical protein
MKRDSAAVPPAGNSSRKNDSNAKAISDGMDFSLRKASSNMLPFHSMDDKKLCKRLQALRTLVATRKNTL